VRSSRIGSCRLGDPNREVLVYFRTVALEEMYRLQRDSDHWDRIYVSELIIEAENRRPTASR